METRGSNGEREKGQFQREDSSRSKPCLDGNRKEFIRKYGRRCSDAGKRIPEEDALLVATKSKAENPVVPISILTSYNRPVDLRLFL